jgi:hypothetical protein
MEKKMSKMWVSFIFLVVAVFLFIVPSNAVSNDGIDGRKEVHLVGKFTDSDNGYYRFRGLSPYGDFSPIILSDDMLAFELQTLTDDFDEVDQDLNINTEISFLNTLWIFSIGLLGILLIRKTSMKT